MGPERAKIFANAEMASAWMDNEPGISIDKIEQMPLGSIIVHYHETRFFWCSTDNGMIFLSYSHPIIQKALKKLQQKQEAGD